MLNQLLEYLQFDLAIDPGTINTVIGMQGEGLMLDEPSVVATDRDSSRVLAGGCAVGHLAHQLRGRTPDRIRVIRPIQGGAVADYALCESMLAHFIRKVRRSGFQLKPRAVVTTPGSITPVQRRALVTCLQRAGVRQIYLIESAKAAAIGARLPVAEPIASLICDIGGGKTDVAVVSFGEVVGGQSIDIAGQAMNRAIVDYMARCYTLAISRQTAEEIKVEIGSADVLEKERSHEVQGLDAIARLPRKASVTSEEIREALLEPLEAIADAVRRTIDRLSPELATDLVDNGMVVCGGGGQLRHIDRYLADHVGLPVRVADDPQTAVARGALMAIEHFERWQPLLKTG